MRREKCVVVGCRNKPRYNFPPYEKSPKWCKKHAPRYLIGLEKKRGGEKGAGR